jgi:tRNA pseudouridine(55) synthase
MSINHNEKTEQSQPNMVFEAYKYRGETLSVFLDRIRLEKDISEDIPMTYAGRLDPMAEGVMLVLVGEACKEKDSYLGFDKTYDFEIMLGVSTDTYDVLGFISSLVIPVSVQEESIEEGLSVLSIKTSWPYPPYSSRTVNGKPLFMYTREGSAPEEMPHKEGSIKTLALKEVFEVSLKGAVNEIIKDIGTVTGDFRQEETIVQWKYITETYPEEKLVFISCTATVTSGVYIRTIAHELGNILGCGALAYSIKRTQIGDKK